MRHALYLAAITICLAGILSAQDFKPRFRFFGDVRARAEMDNRDMNLSSPPNTYTLLRTRFGVEAKPDKNVRVLIQLRDSRVFGSETNGGGSFSTLSDSKGIDLHQAYIHISNLFSDGVSFRVGRQELAYANQRMVGPVGWNNVGRVFDGALLRFDFSGASVDIFGMKTAEVHSYAPVATPAATAAVPDNGQNFFGAYARLTNLGVHDVDFYGFFQGNRLQTSTGFMNFKRYTGGAYAKGSAGAFVYETELAYQGGERGGADVAAYMLTGLAGVSLNNSPVKQVAAGYEYLSGTPSGEADYKSFDPLYPTAHKFFGFMDYFLNIPVHTGNLGMQDILGRVILKFSDRVSAKAWYHHFTLAEDSPGGSVLGDEVDVVVKYRHSEAVAFDIGLSSFFPGEIMRARFSGADTGLWGFIATTVTF